MARLKFGRIAQLHLVYVFLTLLCAAAAVTGCQPVLLGEESVSASPSPSPEAGTIESPSPSPSPAAADTEAPSITGLTDDATVATAKTWSWDCSETCTYRYAVDTSATWTATGTFGSTVSASQITGTGTYYLHVQAQDEAGNLSSVTTVSVVLDNTAPTVTGLSDDATAALTKNWSWGCSETCTYRYVVDTTATWTAIGAFGAGTSTSQVTGTGTYYLHVQAKDSLGNLSSVTTVSVVLDNTAPTVTGLSDDATLTASKTWNWGCSETCTYRYAVDNSATWTAVGGYGAGTTASQASGTGTYYLHVEAKDTVGNLSSVTTVSVVLDTTAPTVTVEQDAGQGDSTAATPILFTVTFSEAIVPAGFTTADITQNGTANVTAWTITNSGNDRVFTLEATTIYGPGTIIPSILASKVVDVAGNGNAISTAVDNSVTYTETEETVEFSTSSGSVAEGGASSAQSFTVTMTGVKAYDVSVAYSVVSYYGTAVNPTDHDLASSSVTIPAGLTSATIDYTHYGDAAVDAGVPKVLQVALSGTNSTGALIGGRQIHRRLILDDDGGNDSFASTSTGQYHSCGITAAGVLKCWGLNTNGQVGDASTTERDEPVTIDSGTSYSAVSAGGSHTCAITVAGLLKCWGLNSSGQVGDASVTQRTAPVDVDALVTYSKVSSGQSHTCAITTGGELKCWGYNNFGQIGDGTYGYPNSPLVIDTGVNYAMVATGTNHTCGIVAGTGVLKCWGDNASYNLGDGTNGGSTSPIVIDTGVAYTVIAAGGSHTCGIVSGSADLKCWGGDTYGQRGDDGGMGGSTPAVIDAGVAYAAVTLGFEHSCGITTGGILKCWGRNQDAQLGNGTITDTSGPVTIESGITYSKIDAGYSHNCGITTGNLLKCWGTGTNGQLGDGVITSQSNSPVVVDSGVTYSKVLPRQSNTCALTSAGAIKCWGANAYGQVGDGTTYQRSAPYTVSLGTVFTEVSTGYQHNCGITSAGVLKCWGAEGYSDLPATADTTAIYSAVSVGYYQTCGITTAGVLKCWGNNDYGHLGDGTIITRNSPVVIDSGTSYSLVSAGDYFTCGITTASVLKCWGANVNGQLGDGSTTQRNSPVIIDAGTAYSKVDLGQSCACGITTGGVLKCWGANGSYQLGDGTTTQRLSPVVIDAGTSYSEVAIESNGCAITTGGVLKCWGPNSQGMLGDGTTTLSTTLIVIDAGTSYSKVGVGGNHTCGVTAAGVPKCWGLNTFGHLGVGRILRYPNPIW